MTPEPSQKAKSTSICPICGSAVRFDPRCPDALCDACAGRAVDALGRAVTFCNEDVTGGLAGVYADTGEPYKGAVCFVDGIECRASERHMGGVVVQLHLKK